MTDKHNRLDIGVRRKNVAETLEIEAIGKPPILDDLRIGQPLHDELRRLFCAQQRTGYNALDLETELVDRLRLEFHALASLAGERPVSIAAAPRFGVGGNAVT